MVLGRIKMNPVAVGRVLLVFGSLAYQLAYGEKPSTHGGTGSWTTTQTTQTTQSPGVITSPTTHESSVYYSSGAYHSNDSWWLDYVANR